MRSALPCRPTTRLGRLTQIRRLGRLAFLGWAVAASLTLAVAPVAAHVNRTVGKYLIFVVLIEEPTFQDNNAGFEFWVRDGERPIQGLDRTLHAAVVGSGGSQLPPIQPMNARGFYDVAIDPGSGGLTQLRLTGTIESTTIDETIDVRFPAYPRVISAGSAVSVPASEPAPANNQIVLAVAGVGLTLAAVAVVSVLRRSQASSP
jgi:hypothetical protein